MKGWDLDSFRQSEAAKRPENSHLLEVKKPAAKRAKYGNSKTQVNGINFQSRHEADFYKKLLWRLKLGEIGLLELQKKYVLIEANETERKVEYWADFVWMEAKTGETIVCDTKSEATRKLSTYIIKRKLMLEKFGIKIFEVNNK